MFWTGKIVVRLSHKALQSSLVWRLQDSNLCTVAYNQKSIAMEYNSELVQLATT